MPNTISNFSVPVFIHALKVLSTLLHKGEAHAIENGIAPAAMLGARLAPDMLPLSSQVQRASDTSKFAVQRIGGGVAPTFADTETTFPQLQERIAQTIAYLDSIDAATIDAGSERAVTLNWGTAGGTFTGAGYLARIALPNFYFHITTAYNILRNQGVKIGKLDYLGPFGPAQE